MANSNYGAIKLSTANNVGAMLKKKTGSQTGYKPSEWADEINLMGVLPVRSASGSIVSISDGADDVPVSSCKVSFTPKQEGSGTPSPSNIRNLSGYNGIEFTQTGKNLYNPNAEIIPHSTYGFFNLCPDNTELSIQLFDKDDTVSMSGISFGFSKGMTENGEQSEVNAGYNWIVQGGTDTGSRTNIRVVTCDQFFFYPKTQETLDTINARYYINIVIGSSVPTIYEAYNGKSIKVALPIGKNLVDVEGRTITSQTTVMSATTFEAGTYILSAHVKNNGTIRGNIRVAKSGSTVAEIQCLEGEDERKSSSSFTLSESAELTIICNGQSAGYNFTFSDLMLEEGSTPTDYVPYRTWYGGEIDLVNKVFKATYGIVDLFSFIWSYESNYQRFKTSTQLSDVKAPPNNNTSINGLCSVFEVSASNNTASSNYDNIIGVSSGKIVQIRDTSLSGDVTSLMTLLSGKRLSYELATPVEYSLTDEEIAEILTYYGVNNFFTDMETGTVDLSYRADIDLLISELEGNRGVNLTRNIEVNELNEELQSEEEER